LLRPRAPGHWKSPLRDFPLNRFRPLRDFSLNSIPKSASGSPRPRTSSSIAKKSISARWPSRLRRCSPPQPLRRSRESVLSVSAASGRHAVHSPTLQPVEKTASGFFTDVRSMSLRHGLQDGRPPRPSTRVASRAGPSARCSHTM
jgi:hypothetical protein